MLTPGVRPEERIPASSVMVRPDHDTNRLAHEHAQNHHTLDHTFLEHAEQEGARAAEGVLMSLGWPILFFTQNRIF